MASSVATTFSKNQIMGLANNLSILIRERHLSENALALALSIPPMTIRRLVSGETLDPHISTIKKIADYFEVSIDTLIDPAGITSATKMRKNNAPAFVPILDWNIASQMESIKQLDLSAWLEWQPVVSGSQCILSESTFALKSKPSMSPRFQVGTLFIIDPTAEPMDGDLVLIKVYEDSGLSIREVSIDSPKWQLKPTIPGSETIVYSPNDHKIIGPVLLTLLYSRR